MKSILITKSEGQFNIKIDDMDKFEAIGVLRFVEAKIRVDMLTAIRETEAKEKQNENNNPNLL